MKGGIIVRPSGFDSGPMLGPSLTTGPGDNTGQARRRVEACDAFRCEGPVSDENRSGLKLADNSAEASSSTSSSDRSPDPVRPASPDLPPPAPQPRELNDRLVGELIDAVRGLLRKDMSDRLRDVYLIGDIEKDTARIVIERMRELANDNRRPITLYINSAGGNVTDGLAIHDAVRQIVRSGIEVTIIVQGMAYSMGSVVLQAASEGRRLSQPHSWIMIHEPAKWAGWQSTSAAAQHLDRLKQMQSQIYELLANRSGRPLKQIIRDTKRNDFYLDARKALEYGLIDGIVDS
jgi:ATP-dependent Clp protease protease subunit